jgi:hypothetical protein
MNVQGREPQGLIPAADYERFRDELIQRIAAIPGPDGRLLGNVSYKPQAVYKNVTNFAPDLITYFGDLRWRAVGGVGYPDIYTFENDTGPDDANREGHLHPERPAGEARRPANGRAAVDGLRADDLENVQHPRPDRYAGQGYVGVMLKQFLSTDLGDCMELIRQIGFTRSG